MGGEAIPMKLSVYHTPAELWMHPPWAKGTKPDSIAVIVGHAVPEALREQVNDLLLAEGIAPEMFQATSPEDELSLTRTLPRQRLAVLGNRQCLRAVVNAIMQRSDSSDVVL